MEFFSALAESADLGEACEAVASEIQRGLGSSGVDLLVVFASASYGADLDRLPVLLHERIGTKALIGCSGASLLDGNTMTTKQSGVCVLAGRMPGIDVAAAQIANADMPHADAPPSAWHQLLPATDSVTKGMVVIGEPFHCDMRALLAGLDFALPAAPKIGGLASGSHHPDGNALFCGRQRFSQGAVVLTISGNVSVEAVVAQGCRPIGKPGRITKADRNRLISVDDKPVKTFVEEQLQTLKESDFFLAEGAPLFLGIASDPFSTTEPTAGDFLIRNVLGIDDNGYLVVGDHLSAGRSVQLHLRDNSSGLDDLQTQLELAHAATASGALMFRCIGRDGEDHEMFRKLAPGASLAGCTCNGEIGPVGPMTHLHAYTASCLLLREGQAT
jgi:small ligand-binding sensory domain FIST